MPGEWHNAWEDNFPTNTKEITYVQRIGRVEMSHRRCDAKLNEKIILEFQNSCIKKNDVDSRKKEWKDFGKDILWIINGDNDTIIERDDDRFIIESTKKWKFDSFKSYKYILYDLQNKIFLLSPNKFKSNQIYGEYYMDKKNCISYFQNIQNTSIKIETIYDKFKNDKEEIKPSIIKKQQGAGNGKTFQIWKDICENINQKQFILVTKQKSAVDTLKEEFIDQWEREEKHIIFNLENISYSQDRYCKKWIIKYSNKNTGRQVTVVIGTIDSLLWSWRKDNKKRHSNFNPWRQNVIDIYEKGVDNIAATGGFRYADQYLKLNKELKINVDESQDLEMIYFNAFVRTQNKYGFDMGFSGDKIQSLQGDINLFTKNVKDLNGFDDISIVETKPTNFNRRIKVKNMAREINKIIKFKDYGCPEISTPENLIDRGKGETVFKVVCWNAIVKNEKNKNAIKLWVGDILKRVREQVLAFDYQPQSFLFEFPILSNRPEIKELLSSLQEFWIKMFSNEDYRKTLPKNSYWAKNNHIVTKKYTEYVKFHQSETDGGINLNESIYKSRIVSILTAKGMGRDVVFILNVTEAALKYLSNHLINLQYESYLHVAVTRAKFQQFFYLTPNGDDIHQRFYDNVDALPYMPKISKFMNISKLKNYIDVNKMISLINIDEIETDKQDAKPSIEWEHHCIRYSSYLMILIFAALELEKSSDDYCDHKKQIETMIRSLSKKKIKILKVGDYWNYLREQSDFMTKEQIDYEFPVMSVDKHPIYMKHMKSIIEKIKFVQNNITNNKLLKNKNLDYLHLICLSHMLSICRNYHRAEPSINELYQLMDLYNDTDEKNENNKNHYEKLMYINKVIQNIINNMIGKNINWNILHKVRYSNIKSDLVIDTKGIPLIGFNDNKVIHFVLKTNFDEADKYGVIIDILLERFLISSQQKNPKKRNIKGETITMKNNNYERYNKKELITYLIVLNSGKFHVFSEIDLKINNDLEFKKEFKKGIRNFFEQKHKELYHYSKYYIDNWNKLKEEYEIKKEENVELKDENKELDLIGLSETPYEFIKEQFKEVSTTPDYIIKFFDKLHNDWVDSVENDDEEKINMIKKIAKNYDNFINELNKILSKHLDRYFLINKKKNNYDF